jgi:uncharacterized membrane protein
VRGPNGWRWRRFRHRLARSIWVVPAVYVLLALVASVVFAQWDENSPLDPPYGLSSSSASTALAALGSGMLAFTGFVTSVVLLVIQFGSTQFSQRYLRWFKNDRTLKHAMGTFVATFLFALAATAFTGRGASDTVPYRTLMMALVLAVASVAWFIVLVSHTMDNLRVAHVTQRVDAQAREVFDAVYPAGHSEVQAGADAVAAISAAEPVQELRHKRVGAVLVSMDRRGLVQEAIARDAVIELSAAVGDHVPTGGVVLRVYGPEPIRERRLHAMLSFGDERTIEDDPAFALRLLVDVAIKALSPAVNDPTTAVQSLHRIEDVLRYASAKHLAAGVVIGTQGEARLVYPTPSWDDLVALSLDEIRAFGAGQYQIARRLRALLDDLVADLPDERRPALVRQRQLLDEAVERLVPAAQRDDALVADPQGLGLGGNRRRLTDRTG